MRVFKCLDHDEMVGSRICMSKDVDLNNIVFSGRPFWVYMMDEQKIFKIHDFYF